MNATREAPPALNRELLERTLLRIGDHPEDWNQQTWATDDPSELPPGNECGTAFCMAGHAVLEAGGTIVWPDNAWRRTATRCNMPGRARYTPIVQAAREVLGLTQDEAAELFAPCIYSYDELADLVHAVIRGEFR